MGIFLFACGSTQFRSTWRDRQFSFQGLQRAMVVVIVPKAETQRLVENEYANSLAQRGIDAVVFHPLAPPARAMPEQQWNRVLAEHRIQFILISRVVSADSTAAFTIPDRHTPGSYLYYSRSLEALKLPKGAPPHAVAYVETRVYDSPAQEVVWLGDSKTTLDQDVAIATLARDFAAIAVNAMYSR